jgi:hypothetical protein
MASNSLPFISELDYQGVQQVNLLRVQGADDALIYFWYNVTHGHYANLPDVVLETDKKRMKIVYPLFTQQIKQWKNLT